MCQLLVLLLVSVTVASSAGAALSKTLLQQAPDECQWVGATAVDMELVCRLRTINSEFENTNFSVIQSRNTIRLSLQCSDALFFQSYLGPDSFRSLVELRALTIEFCKLGSLVEGAFRGLEDLRNLTVRTHNSDWPAMSMEIAPLVFADFRHLNRLDLSLNNIRAVPDGLVCPLKRLTHLNLTHNEIQDLSNLHFSASLSTRKSRICGSSLYELTLARNRISALPAAIFSALGRLRTLDLSHNAMTSIADRAFEGLLSLASVDLSDNRLTHMPPELFAEAKHVREIYLRNNSLNVLAPGLFAELSELLVLDLASNDLTSQWITAATFRGLRRLVSLDLSANKITKVEASHFGGLRSLQVLKLQENYISAIPENAFTELTNLHTLVLSNNRLTSVGEFTFHGLYGIAVLSLDYNRLSKIHDAAFKNCSGLQDLHLNGNKLRTVPDALAALPLLKSIDLGENLIADIEQTSLTGMAHLFGLRLTENLIDFVRKGVFDKMASLTILNLSRNRIKDVEAGSFDRNAQLQAIRLDGNNLDKIEGLFGAMPSLVWLNISDNHMTSFDYAHLPASLQWLDIHANYISQLGSSAEESHLQLATLDASANRLTELTGSSVPNSVQELFLNDNEIASIQPYSFFKKPNLTKVHLTGNKLTTLDANALRLSPVPEETPLPQFLLAGNPLQCDCHLDWVLKINTDSRTHPDLADLASVKCSLAYSRDNSVVPLSEVKSGELLCKYESHCFALCHCCDFAACDCKMECPDGCACYHDHSWATNVVDCSAAGYNASLPQHIPMDATQLILAGNHLEQLSSHSFLGRKRLQILRLNNSHIARIHNRTFNGLQELEVLQLDHNNLTALAGHEFLGLDNLRELHLQHNQIAAIHELTFAHLHTLKVLRLDNNALAHFSTWTTLPPYLNELRLADNPWSCECGFVRRFRDFLAQNSYARDGAMVRCLSARSEEYSLFMGNDFSPLCAAEEAPEETNEILETNKVTLPLQASPEYMMVAVFACLLATLLILVLVFIFRHDISFWCHSRMGVRVFGASADKNDAEKLFDAFVSYSPADEAFIAQHFASQLQHHKLCLRHRDFPASGYTADSILQAMHTSRRTVMVVSENFLKSEWCLFEFKAAHHQGLRERRQRMVVVVVGDLSQKHIDADVQLYLHSNSYLHWSDPLFWEKLRFALPDTRKCPPQPACVHPHSYAYNFHPNMRSLPGVSDNKDHSADFAYEYVEEIGKCSQLMPEPTVPMPNPHENVYTVIPGGEGPASAKVPTSML